MVYMNLEAYDGDSDADNREDTRMLEMLSDDVPEEDVSEYDVPEDPCGHGDVTENFRIECLECGKRFTTEEDDVEEIRCPKCGGVDLEVA